MEGLGRVFNHIHLADAVYINVRDAGAVSFLCYLAAAAGDTWTLTEAKTAAGGSSQALATMTRWHTCTGDGTDTWTLRTQATASTIVTAASATQNCMVVTITAQELSAEYDYIKLASTGNGLVTALAHDLLVQRAPANLAILGA